MQQRMKSKQACICRNFRIITEDIRKEAFHILFISTTLKEVFFGNVLKSIKEIFPKYTSDNPFLRKSSIYTPKTT